MSDFVDPKTLLAANKEDLTVIDVRTSAEYAAGHVPGAVNIPLDELEQRQNELPSEGLIVPYCNMLHPGSSRGEKAASVLNNLGLKAKALQGGFKEWQTAGLPIEETT
jgi:phage shock protein E